MRGNEMPQMFSNGKWVSEEELAELRGIAAEIDALAQKQIEYNDDPILVGSTLTTLEAAEKKNEAKVTVTTDHTSDIIIFCGIVCGILGFIIGWFLGLFAGMAT
jgi:hypothetical protein